MKLAVITFTDQGLHLAETIHISNAETHIYLPAALLDKHRENPYFHGFSPKESEDGNSLSRQMPEIFESYSAVLFLSSAGLALRMIKDHIQHKGSDPAVMVMDGQGHHIISLLSGHLGNANEWTLEIAELTGAKAIITTATDVRGMTAVDELAKSLQARISNWQAAKYWTAQLLKGDEVPVYLEEPLPLPLPSGYIRKDSEESFLKGAGGIWIGGGAPELKDDGKWIQLIPKRWSLGIGCRKNQTVDEVKRIIQHFLKAQGISPESLKNINTIEAKGNEPAIQRLAEEWQLPLNTFSAEEIQKVQHLFPASAWVEENMGVTSVSAPAAYLGADGGQVIPDRRYAEKGVTLSLAPQAGMITVSGIGPGKGEHTSHAVRKALSEAHRVVGYKPYVERLSPWLKEGQIQDRSFMRKEKDRCRHALACAARGEKVVLVSSGDAGVYGMAGLMLELRQTEFPRIPFRVLPGITAANAAASCLGAPLMQDYATISLSDHLIPWEVIEHRIQKATEADFVLVLYNPKSNERVKQWYRAIEVIRQLRPSDTPVGIATRALNEGESVSITTLEQLADADVGMSTTVVIGNSFTHITDENLMITSRGYSL
ncbi:MAG: precorrin-3B C(17)-methyltransferase [Tindallia sp. MSAO_Bac2]|nr:MAG: precorrin-3B C(17)-methyltransferase [Tindallia sp. MSAO_Bac2]